MDLILFAPRLKIMLCVCGSCCVLDVGFSYLDVFGKLKQRIHVVNVSCTCTQWFTYWAWKFIFGPWPFCFKLPTLISFFPPPSPMLHRSVVVEVVLWELSTSVTSTSLQTPVCWDWSCQLMGHRVWDQGHPVHIGRAGSYFFLCTTLGLILFAPRLKMMLCVCGSCCVLDVGCSYLDAFGKLKQRKPCRGRALVDEIHVDDVCAVL